MPEPRPAAKWKAARNQVAVTIKIELGEGYRYSFLQDEDRDWLPLDIAFVGLEAIELMKRCRVKKPSCQGAVGLRLLLMESKTVVVSVPSLTYESYSYRSESVKAWKRGSVRASRPSRHRLPKNYRWPNLHA